MTLDSLAFIDNFSLPSSREEEIHRQTVTSGSRRHLAMRPFLPRNARSQEYRHQRFRFRNAVVFAITESKERSADGIDMEIPPRISVLIHLNRSYVAHMHEVGTVLWREDLLQRFPVRHFLELRHSIAVHVAISNLHSV